MPILECVAVCCSVLQCVAVCCSVLQVSQDAAVLCCSEVQSVEVCCGGLQCLSGCCSVLADGVWTFPHIHSYTSNTPAQNSRKYRCAHHLILLRIIVYFAKNEGEMNESENAMVLAIVVYKRLLDSYKRALDSYIKFG